MSKYPLFEKYNLTETAFSEEVIQNKHIILERLDNPNRYVDAWDIINCPCGGYNEELDELLEEAFKDLLSEKPLCVFLHGEDDEEYRLKRELINYILCSADIMDYGTSPRFGWLTPWGKVVLGLYFKQDDSVL